MCGIAGMVGKGDVSHELYDALTLLQHRGQDAAGIVVCDEDKLHLRKDNGLVNDVFEKSAYFKNKLQINSSLTFSLHDNMSLFKREKIINATIKKSDNRF